MKIVESQDYDLMLTLTIYTDDKFCCVFHASFVRFLCSQLMSGLLAFLSFSKIVHFSVVSGAIAGVHSY